MITSTSLNLDELDQIAQLPTALALAEVGPFLKFLVNEPEFLKTHILPLLAPIIPAREPYIAHTFTSPARGCSLQIFVWAPGSSTPIHDHASWGAYYCVAGSLLEDRYERIDDGSQLNHARLRFSWQRPWQRADGVSTVGPYAEGIHRVANPNRQPAISVHLYGPRVGNVDGRDYDPSRDYVCDRFDG